MQVAPHPFAHELIGPIVTVVIAILFFAAQAKSRDNAKKVFSDLDEDLRAKARVEAQKVLDTAQDKLDKSARLQAEQVFGSQFSGALAKWETDRIASGGGYAQLSARDWVNIMAAIEKQFNGRYLLAVEWRTEMKSSGERFEAVSQRLHDRISALGHDFAEKFQSLNEKIDEKEDRR